MDESGRRPLKSRNLSVMHSITRFLVAKRVSPNVISCLSIVFSLGSLVCFALTPGSDGPWFWVLAAVMIQLRLLANLLDGMVAIEGGVSSKLGVVFNEVPDRFSDAFTLVGLGLAAGGAFSWGLACALMAMLVAYLRAFAASEGLGQIFAGPMAKPQRMFWVTLCALLLAFLPQSWTSPGGIGLATWFLGFIFLGSLLTAFRRLFMMTSRLQKLD